jgi:hypothetical protein
MLVLNPRRVTFAGQTWGGVVSVSVSRSARGLIAEQGDEGMHVSLVDVPGQVVRVEVMQELLGDDIDTPDLGAQGTLEFTTGPSSVAGPARRVTATCVIESMEYEVSLRKGSARRVKLIAVSSNGTSDPVNVVNV